MRQFDLRRPQANRVQTETKKPAQAAPVSFPAPVRGWVENTNVAQGMDGTARVLENWFPTTIGIRTRGGKKKSATAGARVYSMFRYRSSGVEKLFAATATAIYDISALNPTTVPGAAVSSLTGGFWVAAQLGTPGGEFMTIVNGADSARQFDGSAWTTPSITGIASSSLSYVTTHKSRLWFVEKNSKNAWYLPVDAISGAAVKFPLTGVLQRGGALSFIVTWSQDSGDGMDDRIVFVSTEGEVVVYEGTDPSSASTWALVGRYTIARPMGPKCHMSAGGDVLIGTVNGLIPISAIVSKDPAAIDVSAVSAAIEQSWRSEAKRWDGVQPWEIIKWPRENMMMVLLPHSGGTLFVANLQTGAWAKYVGWDAQCGAEFNSIVYFAEKTGLVFAAESGGKDDTASYLCKAAYMPSPIGSATTWKAASMAQVTLQSSSTANVQVTVVADYGVSFPSPPPVTVPPSGSALWDVGLWDVALWDDDGVASAAIRPVLKTGWVSVGANGVAFSPQLQVLVNGTGRPDAEVLSVDIMAEQGAAVV